MRLLFGSGLVDLIICRSFQSSFDGISPTGRLYFLIDGCLDFVFLDKRPERAGSSLGRLINRRRRPLQHILPRHVGPPTCGPIGFTYTNTAHHALGLADEPSAQIRPRQMLVRDCSAADNRIADKLYNIN